MQRVIFTYEETLRIKLVFCLLNVLKLSCDNAESQKFSGISKISPRTPGSGEGRGQGERGKGKEGEGREREKREKGGEGGGEGEDISRSGPPNF